MRVDHIHLMLGDDVEPIRGLMQGLDLPQVIEDGAIDVPAPPFTCLFLSPHLYNQAVQAACFARNRYCWVHLSTAGYDFTPIDLLPIEVPVTRTTTAYAAPIAEYCLHAALIHSRSMCSSPGLYGKTVGVVGFGPIGRRIAEVFGLLGAVVLILARRFRPLGQFTAVRTLGGLSAVDYLILACPLNAETARIVDAHFLGSTKPGMHLINVARGELVEQAELLRRVRSGLMTATLDVTTPDPLPFGHPLCDLPGVTLTNHRSWLSGTSRYSYLNDFLENLSALTHGRRAPGLICRIVH
jgi:phosphoglycerate dehydrogenase-like enzyme